ncbi:class II fumarate hydratase [bacterium]|nr:class II fumarate hydratase [bacterium]
MEDREEHDTMGPVQVPADKLYGAQTVRSIENFRVGSQKMPMEVIYALAVIKKAAAEINADAKLISKEKRDLIIFGADEILSGRFGAHFPLVVYQTGSGTQTHMNVNEVIANLANQKVGGALGANSPIHPNDDVNKSQSSNDVVPSASVIAAVMLVKEKLLPALTFLLEELRAKEKEFADIIKCGRTHMMDAVPLTLGQEFSAFAQQIENAKKDIQSSMEEASFLAIGGTAVGTGLNTPPKFAKKTAKAISKMLSHRFEPAPNAFEALSCMDSLVRLSGSLKTLAVAYMKIGNDIRLLSSGPRCGIGELILPANEPGSSIMPGKVNPTQCEMLTQVACQVMGNDTTIAIAGSSGQLQLNTYRPVVIHNLIESIHLVADAANNFTHKCVKGLSPNEEKIGEYLKNTLMLVTALNPHIGYENAAAIAKKAYKEGSTLKDAAVKLDLLSEEEFERFIDPKDMV